MKRPVIVVEGLDHEGKTTFSRQLAELLKLPYVHYPTTAECFLLQGEKRVDCFLTDMENTVDLLRDGAVVDRYVISTLIYNDVPPVWEERVVTLLSKVDALIITPLGYRLLRAKLRLMELEGMSRVPAVLSLIRINVIELGGKVDVTETVRYFSSAFSKLFLLANAEVGNGVDV